jgi:hypothetical protein
MLAAVTLQSQAPKPAVHAAAKATAPNLAWTYDTPPGFQLLEPKYRFPTQIKQALVQFVQPVPQLARDYQTVFGDKRKFSGWLKGVLLGRKAKLANYGEEGPTVLSSDLSKLSTGPGVITSTTTVHTRTDADLAAIERYLIVLNAWAPD